MPICSACGLDLDIGLFYLERSGKPRKQCKACWNARNSELYRGKRSDYWKRHHAANRERKLLSCKKWRLAHSESNRESIKAWQAANPSKVSEYAKRRYVAINSAAGTVTDGEIAEMLLRYGNRCLCCGTTERLQIDHIVPITKGGTRSIDNLQPLCKSCNCKKHLGIIDYRTRSECQSMSTNVGNAREPGSRIPV